MRKFMILLCIILGLFFLLTGCAAPAATQGELSTVTDVRPTDLVAMEDLMKTPVHINALVIKNGTIIDGTGIPPIPDGILVIQGDRIVAIGPASEFTVPPEVNIIDAEGGTIMPGIINSHAHNSATPEIRRAFLVEGVTTTCSPGAKLNTWSEYEQASTAEGPAARYFGARLVIVAPGGWDTERLATSQFYPVDTPTEARDAVRDMVNLGADMIKIYMNPGDPDNPLPMLDQERVTAIVEEAHAYGLLVRAHANRFSSLNIALQAGVDVIEHTVGMNISENEYKSIMESTDPIAQVFNVIGPEHETLFARMVEQDVVMVPTLSAIIGSFYGASNLTHEQQVSIDVWLEKVRRFHNMGGIIALGNDYGTSGIELGMPLTEMKLLVAAGLTPLEVINAGTRNAAYVCGQDSELGTLDPGKLADIIVVRGNPVTDIQAMGDVAVVIKGGEIAYTSE
jgi:enamidase